MIKKTCIHIKKKYTLTSINDKKRSIKNYALTCINIKKGQ